VVKNIPLWVGLDVHKQTCHATAVDERGEVVLQKNLLNEPEILHEFFQGLDTVAVAMEASYAWEPVYELLERMGLQTHLAHPMKTRIIADAKLKTDMKDSEARKAAPAQLAPRGYGHGEEAACGRLLDARPERALQRVGGEGIPKPLRLDRVFPVWGPAKRKSIVRHRPRIGERAHLPLISSPDEEKREVGGSAESA
jgi:hypothetical protein